MIKLLFKTALVLPLILMRESINLYEGVLNFFFRRQYPFWLDILPNAKTSKNFNVGLESRKSAEVKIYSPNALCRWRAKTFFTKEPETLRWINQFGGDQKVFFDIGANIGLYSIYYSSLFAGKVFAFEPSVFNLECLTRNLNLNNLQDQVVVMTNPLSHRSGVEEFQLQSTEQGGALSGFGVSYGQDGRSLQSVFSYLSYGFSLDAMFESGIISDVPSMIKLDVDGIENLILRGAQKVISDDRCETILVEVNSDFKKLSNEVVEILEKCGFEVNEIQSWNQIWVKSRL